ncbi:MAG: PAS domain S-box protein, partial [Solirubrobacterales bacterium]|nr:PAS domain S-box protein [Solirubrobacterales bacterium]
MDGPARHEALQRLFELSTDLLAVCDREGRLTHVNPAWRSALGWERDDLDGRTFLELVHGADREAARGELRRALEPGTPVRFEVRYATADGGWRWVLWSTSRDGDDWYAVGKDITERKEREDLALNDPL